MAVLRGTLESLTVLAYSSCSAYKHSHNLEGLCHVDRVVHACAGEIMRLGGRHAVHSVSDPQPINLFIGFNYPRL
jgi:hypothetical protein